MTTGRPGRMKGDRLPGGSLLLLFGLAVAWCLVPIGDPSLTGGRLFEKLPMIVALAPFAVLPAGFGVYLLWLGAVHGDTPVWELQGGGPPRLEAQARAGRTSMRTGVRLAGLNLSVAGLVAALQLARVWWWPVRAPAVGAQAQNGFLFFVFLGVAGLVAVVASFFVEPVRRG